MDQPVSPLQDRKLWSWQRMKEQQDHEAVRSQRTVLLQKMSESELRQKENVGTLIFDLLFKYIYTNHVWGKK